MHARLFGAALVAALLFHIPTASAKPAPQNTYVFSGDRFQFADLGFNVPKSLQRKPMKAKAKRKPQIKRQPANHRQFIAPLPQPRPKEADEAVIWSHPLAALPAPSAPVHGNLLRAFARELARAAPSRPLTGVVPPLAEKASQIMGACPGARVISAKLGRERAVVRGSGRPSLHRSGRAVDMAGNSPCIYAQLRKWPGGVSTDYSAVAHVHFSFAPRSREWGARFAHWRPGKRSKRYALRRNHA